MPNGARTWRSWRSSARARVPVRIFHRPDITGVVDTPFEQLQVITGAELEADRRRGVRPPTATGSHRLRGACRQRGRELPDLPPDRAAHREPRATCRSRAALSYEAVALGCLGDSFSSAHMLIPIHLALTSWTRRNVRTRPSLLPERRCLRRQRARRGVADVRGRAAAVVRPHLPARDRGVLDLGERGVSRARRDHRRNGSRRARLSGVGARGDERAGLDRPPSKTG